jgi:hypothetical protein
MLTNNGSDLKTLAAQDVRSVSTGRQLMFSSDARANFGANYGSGQVNAVVNSMTGTKIVLFAGGSPARIVLDGAQVAASAFSFDHAARTIAIELPPGQHTISIDLR